MKRLLCLCLTLVGCSLFSTAHAQIIPEQMRCQVADPTGTPLNVRATPNGKVLARLKNDDALFYWGRQGEERFVRGKQWVKVSYLNKQRTSYEHNGWVLREYIFCGFDRHLEKQWDKESSPGQKKAARDWNNFISTFKDAVSTRDRNKLVEVGFEAADIDELSKNGGAGWKEIDILIQYGTFWDTDRSLSIGWGDENLYPRISACGRHDWFIYFRPINGKWQVGSFANMGKSCDGTGW